MNLLVLGHKGMLGTAVTKYYNEYGWTLNTIDYRWPSQIFKETLRNFKGDLLINCIGAIPQKTADFTINYELPQFIMNNLPPKVKYIHPDTDCVFDGQLPIGELYGKYEQSNALDVYGISKSSILHFKTKTNLKIIRSSIIGIDKYNKSLLSWFLSQTECVNGYINHYWNGITVLQWAKISQMIFANWDDYEYITQIGTTPISKYDLLCLIKDVFHKQINIIETTHQKDINRCLQSDLKVAHIKEQLKELRNK